MKTAMQELLENLQKSFDEKTYPIRIDATYFLEKEKEQIMEAVEFGLFNTHTTIDGEKYYQMKY